MYQQRKQENWASQVRLHSLICTLLKTDLVSPPIWKPSFSQIRSFNMVWEEYDPRDENSALLVNHTFFAFHMAYELGSLGWYLKGKHEQCSCFVKKSRLGEPNKLIILRTVRKYSFNQSFFMIISLYIFQTIMYAKLHCDNYNNVVHNLTLIFRLTG